MTRTFLVAISYDDGIPPDPIGDAQEIDDAVSAAGFSVESVKLWNAPALAAAPMVQVAPPLQQPPAL